MAWDIVSTLLNRPPVTSSDGLTDRKTGKLNHRLFCQSRLRLAVWYGGVMGTILTLLGLGVYRAISHAHEVTIDREIASAADALHDAIEATASNSTQLSRVPSQLLPDLCLVGESCIGPVNSPASQVQDAYQYDYYIRIVDAAGKLIATGGIRPEGLPVLASSEPWQMIQDEQGQEYHQVAIALENDSQEVWAYLLVGRSFQDFDRYLSSVRWSLLIGLLLALALVTAASWLLSGLAMRPIYQSYSQIQQFTADAAHELRTPLAAIRATVESVLDLPSVSEEDAKETLLVVDRQTRRLTSLVSDLLLLSRLDSEKRTLVKVSCCLQDIISDIVEEMAAFAIKEEIALAIDFQTQTPVMVLGNEEQIYRLMLNLVNNAITYTPAGGKVTITLKREQQQAQILISDTGVGIAPEQQAKIFDRFYRVDAARAGQAGNSGLGLAIGQAIAKAHNGILAVTSQLGKGSTFTISLPLSAS